jgi:hypothetical protein
LIGSNGRFAPYIVHLGQEELTTLEGGIFPQSGQKRTGERLKSILSCSPVTSGRALWTLLVENRVAATLEARSSRLGRIPGRKIYLIGR